MLSFINTYPRFPPIFISPMPKAHWCTYSIGRHPSYVVRLSTFSNIFSSEATGPIEAKFHVEALWVGERKFLQMVMVTWPRWPPCPYMEKTWKKSSSPEPKGWWPWNLICSIGYSSTTKFLQMTYFTARSNLVPYAFVWEKGKTMDFSETIVVYDLKLATDDQSDKKFPLTLKLCPLGAVCPLPWGYIHVLNHEKNGIESYFKEISLKLAISG